MLIIKPVGGFNYLSLCPTKNSWLLSLCVLIEPSHLWKQNHSLRAQTPSKTAQFQQSLLEAHVAALKGSNIRDGFCLSVK